MKDTNMKQKPLTRKGKKAVIPKHQKDYGLKKRIKP